MGPALQLTDISLELDGTTVLSDVDWTVAPGERWVILGANGAGKTTLLRVAALYQHPSRGTVEVLGARLGPLRRAHAPRADRVLLPALGAALEPRMTAAEVVMTAKYAALAPWWHTYTPDDRARALELLDHFRARPLADHRFPTLSAGERQRVLLARTLMNEPGIVLLDEPTAGLDVGGREELVHDLTQWARDSTRPPLVLVTHHLEEIPPGFTHALVMKDAKVLTSGPLAETVTSDVLSDAFGLASARRRGRRALRRPPRMSEIISTRGRSVVTRGDGVVHKRYRRADPRNDVERAAYRHLAGYAAPTPRLVEITDDGIVLEDVANVGDYEAALGGDHALDASRALGRAYAELHEVPPAGAPTPQRLEVEHLHAWCDAMDVTRPDLGWAVAAYDDPGPMLAFSHGDPAPSNTLLRADGGVVLLDFEYAGARHRGYDLAAWHVLCPLEPALLDALHDGYGRAIDGFDALIVWRAVQVVAMNRTELLHADREFAPGWSARASLLTALRRGGEHEPGLLPLHDALARRWPGSADRLPTWA